MEGVSKELEILDAALFHGIIKKAGSWFSMGDKKIAQGRDQALRYLKDEPEVTSSLLSKVKELAKAL